MNMKEDAQYNTHRNTDGAADLQPLAGSACRYALFFPQKLKRRIGSSAGCACDFLKGLVAVILARLEWGPYSRDWVPP